jgi:hypothetical protein
MRLSGLVGDLAGMVTGVVNGGGGGIGVADGPSTTSAAAAAEDVAGTTLAATDATATSDDDDGAGAGAVGAPGAACAATVSYRRFISATMPWMASSSLRTCSTTLEGFASDTLPLNDAKRPLEATAAAATPRDASASDADDSGVAAPAVADESPLPPLLPTAVTLSTAEPPVAPLSSAASAMTAVYAGSAGKDIGGSATADTCWPCSDAVLPRRSELNDCRTATPAPVSGVVRPLRVPENDPTE